MTETEVRQLIGNLKEATHVNEMRKILEEVVTPTNVALLRAPTHSGKPFVFWVLNWQPTLLEYLAVLHKRSLEYSRSDLHTVLAYTRIELRKFVDRLPPDDMSWFRVDHLLALARLALVSRPNASYVRDTEPTFFKIIQYLQSLYEKNQNEWHEIIWQQLTTTTDTHPLNRRELASGKTLMHEACESGEPFVGILLSDPNSDFSIIDNAGHTPLWYLDPRIISAGIASVVMTHSRIPIEDKEHFAYIRLSANMDVENFVKLYPREAAISFYQACKTGDVQKAKWYLQQKIDMTGDVAQAGGFQAGNGSAPPDRLSEFYELSFLETASTYGHLAIVELLINDPQFDAISIARVSTALAIALRYGQRCKEIAKKINAKRPELFAQPPSSGHIHPIAEMFYLRASDELLSRAISTYLAGADDDLICAKLSGNLDQRESKKLFLMHIACRIGDIETIKLAIEKNIALNVINDQGMQPFHMAWQNLTSNDEAIRNTAAKIVMLLLKQDAQQPWITPESLKTDTGVIVTGEFSRACLIRAVLYRHQGVIRFVLAESTFPLDVDELCATLIPLRTSNPKKLSDILHNLIEQIYFDAILKGKILERDGIIELINTVEIYFEDVFSAAFVKEELFALALMTNQHGKVNAYLASPNHFLSKDPRGFGNYVQKLQFAERMRLFQVITKNDNLEYMQECVYSVSVWLTEMEIGAFFALAMKQKNYALAELLTQQPNFDRTVQLEGDTSPLQLLKNNPDKSTDANLILLCKTWEVHKPTSTLTVWLADLVVASTTPSPSANFSELPDPPVDAADDLRL